MPFLPALLAACCLAAPPSFDGRTGQIDVEIPRIEAEAAIDGNLNEAVWQKAARLTGFSRYAPTDGVAADDSTEVFVWYSPTAIHFGVRAYAEPGTVRAVLADRDKIYNGDYLGFFLGTFNDGRQASVFAVNPLGIQGDGIVVETGRSGGGGFGGIQGGREPTDVSPDYVFQSKGRVTDYGYEVEVRIPFKSLRYQSAPRQTWGFNVIRVVQSRGYEYSWSPARRDAASYLAQAGHLSGLTDLRRGIVLDVNPVVTANMRGAPVPGSTAAPTYGYVRGDPRVGGNVRWGITNNVTLNATIRPDFAEVESDAGQVVYDPRQSLFFSERRPFFLDGIEQFNVPNQLIYTRRIAAPLGAAKVAGKAVGVNFAALTAVDDKSASFDRTSPNNAAFGLLRVQRDVGTSSRVGGVFTTRTESGFANHVGGVDGRVVWRKIYSAQLQGALSATSAPGGDRRVGPLYNVDLRRTGRTFATRYSLNAISTDFQTDAGFINRPAVANLVVQHTVRAYGSKEALFQNSSFDVNATGLWKYDAFIGGDDLLEKKLHFNANTQLKGGWRVGASYLLEAFGYDPDLYANRYVVRTVGARSDTVPFVGLRRITNRDYVLSLTTPNFRTVSANFSYIWGRDEDFFEWAPSDIGFVTGGVEWRPTQQLRLNGTYVWQWYVRSADGTMAGETRIPRVRAEYQINRFAFVRLLAEYRADYVDDLRDVGGAGGPILVRTARGYVQGRGFSTVTGRAKHVNTFRPEALFSYVPVPGTVVFLGYGSTLSEPQQLRFSQFDRVRDAVFVKLSYLWRRV